MSRKGQSHRWVLERHPGTGRLGPGRDAREADALPPCQCQKPEVCFKHVYDAKTVATWFNRRVRSKKVLGEEG